MDDRCRLFFDLFSTISNLSTFRKLLGALGGGLGASSGDVGAVLGRSGGVPGTSWGGFGEVLGPLGASLGGSEGSRKTVKKETRTKCRYRLVFGQMEGPKADPLDVFNGIRKKHAILKPEK